MPNYRSGAAGQSKGSLCPGGKKGARCRRLRDASLKKSLKKTKGRETRRTDRKKK